MLNIANMRQRGIFDQTTLDIKKYVPPINQPYIPCMLYQQDFGVVVPFIGEKNMSPRHANLILKLSDAGIQVDYVLRHFVLFLRFIVYY